VIFADATTGNETPPLILRATFTDVGVTAVGTGHEMFAGDKYVQFVS
jgi:hypothetical protein